MTKKNKLIVTVLVVAILIPVIYMVVLMISRIGKVPVTVNVLPLEAPITRNDQPTRSGTQYVEPGTYTYTASSTGYEPASQTITVTRSSEAQVVDLLPLPVSSDAIEWATANSELYQPFEERGAERSRKAGLDDRKKYPIVEKLPFTGSNPSYTIGYRTTDGRFTVTIYAATSLERQAALGEIIGWGYDPADYELDFVDFNNPLGDSL